MKFTSPPSDIVFPRIEEEVLERWKQRRAFERSIEQRSPERSFSFYDGPPFATGLPHYGHLLVGTIKDVVARYETMRGCRVERRFGWDCHGLPVSSTRSTNATRACPRSPGRRSVWGHRGLQRRPAARSCSRYTAGMAQDHHALSGAGSTSTTTTRPWTPWYMESGLAWVVKPAMGEGPYLSRRKGWCPSPLALRHCPCRTSRRTSNYQDVQDPAVTVLFKLDDERRHLASLAWTTTPWTLPSNLALVVNPDAEYRHTSRNSVRKVNRPRADTSSFAQARTCRGELARRPRVGSVASVQLRWSRSCRPDPTTPLFDVLRGRTRQRGRFSSILADDYVCHSRERHGYRAYQAPAFGEDDFTDPEGREHGIERDRLSLSTMSGRFTAEVPPYFEGMAGQGCGQDTSSADLKDTGRAVHATRDVIVHSYPFCPRSDTPIIYRTIDCLVRVRVEPMRSRSASPPSTRRSTGCPGPSQGRANGQLARRCARDWNDLTQPFLGQHRCQSGSTTKPARRCMCMGSRDELREAVGSSRSKISTSTSSMIVVIPSPSRGTGSPGPTGAFPRFWIAGSSRGPCRTPSCTLSRSRIQTVFENGFPAEFISEALDQTRGWFYTLHRARLTALYD